MDLDGDGHQDILSGSYGPRIKPVCGRFQVLYGKADGSFAKPAVLNGTDGKPLHIEKSSYVYKDAINTRPTAVDWNFDGKLDLIVGNSAGNFYFFKGEGQGKFLPKSHLLLDTAGRPLYVRGGHADPVVIDWDGDGDLDLLSGSGVGDVFLAENRAPKGQREKKFAPFSTLVKVQGRQSGLKVFREEDLAGPISSTRIWVDDINTDGKLDLLVGDTMQFLEPAEDISDAEFESRLVAIQEEMSRLYRAAKNTAMTEEQSKANKARSNELYELRNKMWKRTKTGFVWLYLQK